MRSDGCVPAADADDAVLWLLYEPLFKGAVFSHSLFLLPACSKRAGRYAAPKQHPGLISSVI